MNAAWLDSVVELVDGPALCAGVVIGPGEVATAYHCVAAGMRPKLYARDGRSWLGRVTAADPASDLAIVAAPLDLPARPLRDTPPEVGSSVWAIGHPFVSAAGGRLQGLLAWSVTHGVLSAANDVLLQTDAPVNPGNSGGPLLDDDGAVLGIASRKIVGDGIAFFARTSALEALRADPRPLSVLGGSWGLAIGVNVDGPVAPFGEAWLSVRERLVVRAGAGARLGDDPAAELVATGALRQRLGRGPYSATIEAGGGLQWLDMPRPVLTARVGFRLVGVGILVDPGPWNVTFSLDLAWPGEVGVF